MSVSRRRNLAAIVAATAGVGLGISTGDAAQYQWNGSADTNYSNPANWTPGTSVAGPTSGDEARFIGAAAYGVSPNPSNVGLSAPVTVGEVDVAATTVNFSLNGQTLTINDSSNPDPNIGHSTINGNGELKFLGSGTVTYTAGNRLYAGFGSNGTATFDAGATVNWGGGHIKIGYQSQQGTINIKGGTTFNSTAGQWRIGDYATTVQATLNVDGAGTVVNNSGASILFPANSGVNAASTFNITNGAVWNDTVNVTQNFGDTGNRVITWNIDGAGSRFNTTTDAEMRLQNGLNVNVTNGGVLNFSGDGTTEGGDTFTDLGRTSNFLIDGAGSQLNGGRQWTVAGRNRLFAAGASNLTISNGGELVATGYNQAAVVVHPKATVRLNNGAIRVGDALSSSPMGIELRNGAGLYDTIIPDSFMATLTGRGTIIQTLGTGGYEALDADPGSRISPGDGTGVGLGTVGTITIQGGDLRTRAADTSPNPHPSAPLRPQTFLNFDISTASGNPHDQVDLTTVGQLANIEGTITYADIGIAPGATGFMDIFTADSIEYTLANLSSGDIPLNTDNLDSLMATAGYTRTTNLVVLPGEYRYYIAQNVLLDDSLIPGLTIDALRIEFAAIPEPTSLGLLALGGLATMRRRRQAR